MDCLNKATTILSVTVIISQCNLLTPWAFSGILLIGSCTINTRRETKQRDAILRILRNTRSHPTAQQIYEKAKQEIPSISRGTVYRNLEVLQEMGTVTELTLGGISQFEYTLDNHYHFRCNSCGVVTDIDHPVNPELNRMAAKRTGLLIKSHQLEFRGVCHQCRLEARNK